MRVVVAVVAVVIVVVGGDGETQRTNKESSAQRGEIQTGPEPPRGQRANSAPPSALRQLPAATYHLLRTIKVRRQGGRVAENDVAVLPVGEVVMGQVGSAHDHLSIVRLVRLCVRICACVCFEGAAALAEGLRTVRVRQQRSRRTLAGSPTWWPHAGSTQASDHTVVRRARVRLARARSIAVPVVPVLPSHHIPTSPCVRTVPCRPPRRP
jgi:hypothetical protein